MMEATEAACLGKGRVEGKYMHRVKEGGTEGGADRKDESERHTPLYHLVCLLSIRPSQLSWLWLWLWLWSWLSSAPIPLPSPSLRRRCHSSYSAASQVPFMVVGRSTNKGSSGCEERLESERVVENMEEEGDNGSTRGRACVG